jgi:hypothetical protein
MRARLTRWLATTDTVSFSLYAVAVAFTAYFSMYAFRKPFAVGTFPVSLVLAGREFSLKTLLVISQIIGYACSKFLGIKFITELDRGRRAAALVGLISVSELALLVFAAMPPAGKMAAIFVSGLPLGMIWGLVFSFLEGRRASDAMGAGLSASYILSSGAVKSVGKWLLQVFERAGMSQQAAESWMPFTCGLLFFPLIVATAWLLAALPAPSEHEAAARTRRTPMGVAERRAFFAAFAPGLAILTVMSMVLTAFRDVRDNYAPEIWIRLGFGEAPWIFAASEVPVTTAVLLALGVIVVIRRDRSALLLQMAMMVGGMALIGGSTLAFDVGSLGGASWMVLIGVGMYVAYVPPGCFLFDRLIGATRFAGTAVFMIFVTDAFGYAASVAAQLYREWFSPQLEWLAFLRYYSYGTSVVGTLGFGFSALYFARRTR